MSDLPFRYSILRVPQPNDDNPLNHFVEIIFADRDLTMSFGKTIVKNNYVGNVVMDRNGRSWRFTSINISMDSGLSAIVFGRRKIQYGLSEELHLPFEDIKTMVRNLILAYPENAKGYMAVENESPETAEELAEQLLEDVSNARSPLELLAIIEFKELVYTEKP